MAVLDWLSNNGSPWSRKEASAALRDRGRDFHAWSVPSLRSVAPVLGYELDRARRYERPLSLMVLSMHRRADGERVPVHMSLLTAALVKEVVREIDIVAHDAVSERFVILLPESESRGARHAARRIDDMLGDRMQVGLRAGLALFPGDGLTLFQLLECGEARRQEASIGAVAENGSGDHERISAGNDGSGGGA